MPRPKLYVKNFSTRQAHDAVYGNAGYIEPWLGHSDDDNHVSYNIPEAEKYLTVTALEDGFKILHSNIAFEYSINFGPWKTSTPNTYIEECNAGDTIRLKAEVDEWIYGYEFLSNKTCNMSGNIMSLIYGDNFVGQTDMTDCCFKYQFCNVAVVDASKLVIPATTLAYECYVGMFADCTTLVTAPSILPSTTLVDGCYYYMFKGCSSLTTAPALPATTLAQNCYMEMFRGCTSLTTAPALPATTLASHCYYSMFDGCTSLTTAPELPATTLADSCYMDMFIDCTSLTTAPELPATTLVDSCYTEMFCNCTSLNYIKAMFLTDPSGGEYTDNWVGGVAQSGTFVKNYYAEWDCTGSDCIPQGWTVEEGGRMVFWNDTFDRTTQMFAALNHAQDDTYGPYNGAKKYVKTNNTLSYNGQTCYLWEIGDCADEYPDYILTSTGDASTLRSQSIDVAGDVPFTALVAFLDGDTAGDVIYEPNSNRVAETQLIKMESDTVMWIDEFEEWEDDPQYFVDDPEGMGSNAYAYTGNTINIDGTDYHLWEFDESLGCCPSSNVHYALTTTADYDTLAAQSIKESGTLAKFNAFYNFMAEDDGFNYEPSDSEVWSQQLIRIDN